MPVNLRTATLADLDELASLVTRANQTYSEWAGASWQAPGPEKEREGWRSRLEDAAAWSLVADRRSGLVGCISFTDARTNAGEGRSINGLAHLSRMFVDPGCWRAGIGSALLVAATAEMRRRGYERAELFTAAANAGSRGFYEHHGWRAGAESRRWQGLTLILYTFDLAIRPPA